jgi:hypothetical protein
MLRLISVRSYRKPDFAGHSGHGAFAGEEARTWSITDVAASIEHGVGDRP